MYTHLHTHTHTHKHTHNSEKNEKGMCHDMFVELMGYLKMEWSDEMQR
jgi:hypothetical protein